MAAPQPPSTLSLAWHFAKVATITVPLVVFDMVLTKLARLLGFGPAPSSPLERVADNLYVAEGTAPVGCSITMMVVKRDSKLCVFSPLPPEEGLLAAVDKLGTVSLLVFPHGMHGSHCPAWAKHYPAARVCAPEEELAAIQEKNPGVTVVASERPLRKEFAVTTLSPPLGTMKNGDAVHTLKVEGKEGGTAVLFHDIQINFKVMPLHMRLAGWGGRRTARIYKAVGVRSWSGLKKFLVEEVAALDPSIVVYAHGGAEFGPGLGELIAAAANAHL